MLSWGGIAMPNQVNRGFLMTAVLILIFVFFVVMDQLSKAYAVDMLVNVGNAESFIPGLIRFEYRQNTGMAWGLLPDARIFFIVITVILFAGITYFMVRYKANMPSFTKVSLTVILAGAMGNFIDRLFIGYVRDFIAFDFFEFPVFNVADTYVTIGAVLLFVSIAFTKAGRKFAKQLDEPKKNIVDQKD